MNLAAGLLASGSHRLIDTCVIDSTSISSLAGCVREDVRLLIWGHMPYKSSSLVHLARGKAVKESWIMLGGKVVWP